MRLIIDAHLDLSWNALSFDRDQTLEIPALRAREAGMTHKSRTRNTVSLLEMRRAGIGVCLATLLARSRPDAAIKPAPERSDLDYANQTIASAVAMGQLGYYRLLEEQGQTQMLRTAADLKNHWARWTASRGSGKFSDLPIGLILSMEGADPIVEPQQAQWWWDQGLRTVCLAHYGQSAYAMGTGGDGPLTARGRKLLQEFARLGMILDLVHTADIAVAQALEQFPGAVFVSHGNCRALRPGDRQISDDQLRAIGQRGGVIGVVLDAWMLYSAWKLGETANTVVSLADLANHIDHICQITGSSAHAAIGSDLDGGFGTEQCPHDLDTISDLHKLEEILARRGYSAGDIDGIFSGNWLRFFLANLPQ